MAKISPTQRNGSQGSTTFGPVGCDVLEPSYTADNMVKREIVLQLDGSVETAKAFIPNDDSYTAFDGGCLILEAFVNSKTGLAALSVGAIDDAGAGSNANILPAAVVPANGWRAVRDIDLVTATGTCTQLAYAGLLPTETAIVRIVYLTASREEHKANGGVESRPLASKIDLTQLP